ncbi:beta-ketoacyl synthase N-terminal-like domain-containing protein [Piscinibacter sakaiensis]|uniref:Nodulation protein E n=1 Tax=Piscinibacter sakaiensis TaxID=1547922 RepID=A0A0K8NTU8_PISS1|nr:beta-ketoacyl synthase N-terminal-like domain-containing protein [Piscinibacter sakaiensis]GAP33788.1 3-oxoacyl-ACP synthase, KASII [Piscinibacter sakaiensis]
MSDRSHLHVTGLGLVAPHGRDPAAVFDALCRGDSAVRPILPQLVRPAAAAAVDFEPSPWFSKLQLAGVDRVSQLAVAAADLALRDAGAARADALAAPERIGVFVGCGMGGAASLEAAYQAAPGRVPPLTVPAFMPNAPAAHVAMRQGARGPVLSYAVACASSAVAIGEAAKALAAGEIDLALAGGTESLLTPGVVQAWQAMQTLAPIPADDPAAAARACRPFSRERAGFVLGEGAAFLVLERAADAAARGARARARLAGWGLSCDARHLTQPDATGQAAALRQALRRADLAPRDVGYCNAHGTATRIGDQVEAEALATVWGPALADLRVSSTKALHGHLLGAAGALEAAVTVLAVERRACPPAMHADPVDPACGLALVAPGDTAAPGLQAALSSSFAFGGSNSALVFTRP